MNRIIAIGIAGALAAGMTIVASPSPAAWRSLPGSPWPNETIYVPECGLDGLASCEERSAAHSPLRLERNLEHVPVQLERNML